MEFGICVASHIGDIGYIERAEALGYTHAWCADSQMLWSDCYATLALAASRTSRINLGTGVAVTGTRPAPVNAAGIATINALAPGRTFFGVGAGNTAMRVMGKAPHRLREYDAYLAAMRPLLAGEEAMWEGKPIRHIMPDKGIRQLRVTNPHVRLRVRPQIAGPGGQAWRRCGDCHGRASRSHGQRAAHDRQWCT
ncbi:MAG: LLM class flavin-dependent oxidoreductase [Pseudomonadales bacterium]|nr:LLM class flavin-dependent oxidoreductase [Pseudomonadales bacterium]